MSETRGVNIECDVCGHIDFYAGSVTDATGAAKEEGWRIVKKRNAVEPRLFDRLHYCACCPTPDEEDD